MKYYDAYTISDAKAMLVVLKHEGYKGYIQTLSGCRYQVRYWN